MSDPSRHASHALTLLTTGQPPVFYDTLRREYRPVHYPSGLGHIAITESILSCLYHPKDVKDAASWPVQFGSVLVELIEYHISSAMIASSIVDLLLIARGRLPIFVVLPLTITTYLACIPNHMKVIPFFQSLAVLAASIIALVLNSRLLPGLLALGAITIHFYSIIVVIILTLTLLWVKREVTIANPVLLGSIIGTVVQYPYVHWSIMTYFPCYPAHPNHLPPDRIHGLILCLLSFLSTAFIAYPVLALPTINDLPYVLPFGIVIATIIIRACRSLPMSLKIVWIECAIMILTLTAISGSIVGARLLVVTPLLTTISLSLLAADGYLSASAALYGYCILTINWWLTSAMYGGEFVGVQPAYVLKEHWKLFYRSFCSKKVVATVPEGSLPFTCSWKPREVAEVVRTFPDSNTRLLLTARKGSEILLYVPPVRVSGEYVVRELSPTGRVWVADDRAGSLRRNVLIGVERYGHKITVRVRVVNHSWVGITVIITGKLRKGAVILSAPERTLFIDSYRTNGGFLVRAYGYNMRTIKITISGARWIGNRLVFHGSLRDLVANMHVTGDLV